MADQSHLDILTQGVEAWNSWREKNPSVVPDLSGAPLGPKDLHGANLSRVNLSGALLMKANLHEADLHEADLSLANLMWADLHEANLDGADLSKANLMGHVDLSWAKLKRADLSEAKVSGANLTHADLSESHLFGAKLFGADLSDTNLSKADLSFTDLTDANLSRAILRRATLRLADLRRTDLSRADLSEADFTYSIFVRTNLTGANLTGCTIYGISAWSLKLEGATQKDLIISPDDESAITTDDLEVAQFIYLLLNNEKIRQVIDTITSKVVLILGRFTSERKAVLEALRDSLRQHDYLPVLFNFEGPTSRDLTESISTLAHMARFIIADITEAKSIPQELQAIVPNLPSVPVQPLLLASEDEYGMFEHFKHYPWVLEVYRYDNLGDILTSLESKIILPAEAKAIELSR